MSKYYAVKKDSTIIRTFISKANRDAWVMENPEKRRVTFHTEARKVKRQDNNQN